MLWYVLLAGTLVGFGLALVLFGDLASATSSRASNGRLAVSPLTP